MNHFNSDITYLQIIEGSNLFCLEEYTCCFVFKCMNAI